MEETCRQPRRKQKTSDIMEKSTAALLPDASDVFVTLTIKANIRRESSVKIMQDFVASNRNNTCLYTTDIGDSNCVSGMGTSGQTSSVSYSSVSQSSDGGVCMSGSGLPNTGGM
ncbi:hypothetical protein HZH68_014504 [Vespula germanica]|uniref:Uncharacterized protein n=1 Tax=Vespula germanica TaxID=30212 RepID=A0A834MSJ1_VESGE|nr:hypothetical protein HZH68_014504 [Vespula germanica]